jgi:hypothetical protein
MHEIKSIANEHFRPSPDCRSCRYTRLHGFDKYVLRMYFEGSKNVEYLLAAFLLI